MPGKKNTNLDTIGLEMGNTPPQALDVEEAVLGAMLLEASAVDQAMEELTPSCFYDQRHRMIFEAISHLVTEHISVDILTATNKLKQEGNLEAVGGAITLANLSQKVGSAAHIEYHIKILKQKSIQRELITASYDILHQAYDESVKVDDLVDNAQTKIFDAIQNNLKKEVQGIGDLINVAMSDIQKMQNSIGLSGVPSGFVSLDAITMGWQKSDLIILAARPAIGKTAFALFSLEMSAVQLTKRLMTSESGLPASKIKGGSKLEPYEWEQLEYKLKNLSAAPLYIDDTPSIPVMEFRTKVKNLVKSKQVRLVIVDYLQLMQGPSELRGMREQEVAAISRTLKQTAKELEVPIIALSQLSRQSVQRSGGSGRPQLSDLRESGSIEQDADMVIFIHRPDALGLSENPSSMEETQIIIAKHRNGSVGELPMIFKSEQIRFMEPNETLDVRAATTVASGINASASDDFSNPNF